MDEKLQMICMKLVVNGGDAKSKSIEALRLARSGRFEEAEKLIEECEEILNEAHEVQIDMLQEEARGNNIQVYLLMVHAQDHFMNALTVKDLAVEIIELTRQLSEKAE